MSLLVFLFFSIFIISETLAQTCVLDSFDKLLRNDKFPQASLPFIGFHKDLSLCAVRKTVVVRFVFVVNKGGLICYIISNCFFRYVEY